MTPAIDELRRAGVPHSVHEYERDDRRVDFGAEAAERLGLDTDRVFKTLLVTADGRQVVAIVPVSTSLSLKAVGRLVGAKRVDLCQPEVAERVTGYVRGGISPFGQRRRHVTVVDEIALLFDRVYVSGGRRGLDVAVAPTDLVRLLDARAADITSR